MKRIQIFIFSIAALLLFFGCNRKDLLQYKNSSSTQSSASVENQNEEISSLRQRINELEAELKQKERQNQNSERINKLETELQRRVGHLENYFDRRTPESVARLYGEAVKTRNGALQYALFSKELKDKTYDYFVSVDWHTGVSNPNASDFTVDKPIRSEDGQAVINIIFRYTVSGGTPSDAKTTLSLKQTQKEINNDWYITSVKDAP